MSEPMPGRDGLVLLLGLLTAFGSVSIDLYWPAFPAIAREFGSPVATVQYKAAAYMGGRALGQLLCGPPADQYGRKSWLLAGEAVNHAAPPFLLPYLLVHHAHSIRQRGPAAHH